jgi:uncharacterized glyoxalase superfamily protein PhnB
MTDPFTALRQPVVPIAPDPAFAANLRARLRLALDPKGTHVTTALDSPATTSTVVTSTVVPYLAVAGAGRAIVWYTGAFDAHLRGEPIVMPDGRIGHAELEIAGGFIMLADEYPEIGHIAPTAAGSSVSLHVTVPDVDAAVHRAVAAGAALESEPSDEPYGRAATIRDPFLHRWLIHGPVRGPVREPVGAGGEPRHGDIAYVSLWVPDVHRARRFFGAVLGWRYEPDGSQVEGLSLHHGLWASERSTLFLCIGVSDLYAAVHQVRQAGGTAEEPHEEPYGRISDCVDDQGMRFALCELRAGAGPRLPANGAVHGDLSYVTVETVDSARFRAFFGSVAGWQFTPGRVEDGWAIEDIVPMTGMQGGHAQATVVPMYRVDDIATAVGRVRAAGGTSTDPEPQPYGVTADCTDDQGTHFYLGTL